jgi:dTDP-4-amino-4,6-dideoxygalactose transaminase
MTNTNSLNYTGSWPCFSQEEADIVAKVLLSNKVNYWAGTEGREFEKEFAVYSNTKHAIALANGTVALDLALHGLEIGLHNGGSSDDEVIVTPRSFLASVSSIVNAGAKPVFADVDEDTQNITPSTIKPVITHNTCAILCVHLAGWPCDIDGIKDITEGQNIKLIEDCAQAHGAQYKGQPVGSLGDVAAWSFCQDKIMTTGGEGGMVTCDDTNLWRKMWAYKDHGKNWDAVYNKKHAPGFRWVHETFGTNWRLTEMQSAIGRIQLKRMPEWTETRNNNAQIVADLLAPYAKESGIFRIPNLPPTNDIRHAHYKFYAFVRPENLKEGQTRDTILENLNAQGLFCTQGSCSEMYLEKAFDGSNFRPKKRLPVAKSLGETSIMFTVHPGMDYSKVELSF